MLCYAPPCFVLSFFGGNIGNLLCKLLPWAFIQCLEKCLLEHGMEDLSSHQLWRVLIWLSRYSSQEMGKC